MELVIILGFISRPRKVSIKLKDNYLQPIVGVSACLNGEQVRYDGTHKLQPLIQAYLQPFVELDMICPEVSAGLGVPRAPIRLQAVDNDVRAIVAHDSTVNERE